MRIFEPMDQVQLEQLWAVPLVFAESERATRYLNVIFALHCAIVDNTIVEDVVFSN